MSAFNISQIEFLPVDSDQLRRATTSDPVLSKVVRFTQQGWPAQVEDKLKPFYHRRTELTVEAGCLLWGMRVIVPEACQDTVLAELHTSHQGMVRMKSLARLHVWWPSIDKRIEELVRSCQSCQSVRNRPSASLLHPWSWPDRPWKRIHVDFAGPFQESMFMLVVDAHSKWLEVIPMKSTTVEKTIEALRNLFASHGLPEQLVSDNGPQFTAAEFEQWMRVNGVKHIKTSPYHPSSNGEAERYVQTMKQALRASRSEEGSLNLKLNRFLLTYRTTPNATTGVSPAELFLKRPLRTRLDLLRPSVATRVRAKQAEQKQVHDARGKFRSFEVGQSVLARNLREGPKWLPATIVEQTGPVSYRVQLEDCQIWRRHADQLLDLRDSVVTADRSASIEESIGSDEWSVPPRIPLPVEGTPTVIESPETEERETNGSLDSTQNTERSTVSTPRRYPRREHRAPERLEPSL